MEQELVSDPKERAEHLMLVDLGRNDVGRVAEVGSVEVTEYASVEKYSHVMHLVSNVQGRLRSGLDWLDLLRATFPAGTLSGAPKVRAMEIIDELETVRRGPFGGCCGYLDYSGNMDLAITIRTMLVNAGRGLGAGGRRHRGRLRPAPRVPRMREQGACADPGDRSRARGCRLMPRLLMIDNYDSFTYNLVQYLGELGAEVEVLRNDAAPVEELLARRPDGLVISPGPGRPADAGVTIPVIRPFASGRDPGAGRVPRAPGHRRGLRRPRGRRAHADARQDVPRSTTTSAACSRVCRIPSRRRATTAS